MSAGMFAGVNGAVRALTESGMDIFVSDYVTTHTFQIGFCPRIMVVIGRDDSNNESYFFFSGNVLKSDITDLQGLRIIGGDGGRPQTYHIYSYPTENGTSFSLKKSDGSAFKYPLRVFAIK